MSFAEDEHVIQTLPSDRANKPFREGILPRATWGGEDFLETHALHAAPKLFAVDGVAIAQKIRRCRVVREGVYDLLGRPVGGGMLGDVEEHDAPAVVGEHDEDEEDAQPGRGHREEVQGDRSVTWLARNVRHD